MTIQLPELPYAPDALAPHISERTIGYHYGKHHAAYVKTVNDLTAGTPEGDLSLEALVRSLTPDAGNAKLFNAAAQAWNHEFYWRSMSPDGGGEPDGDLATALAASFGSVDEFRRRFASEAMGNFASGWGWLVYDSPPSDAAASDTAASTRQRGALRIVQTDDADTPLAGTSSAGATAARTVPLLVVDVWEHAYYLDYQNARAAYLDAFVEHLICWEFASANYAAARRAVTRA
ncbi:superoxide dismutase [Candidatus Poriferisodalis sp.]|uniref:superoxide dismutase n=1 Tax=Candidatus Poriferisodalis sp. TaxID=3101277 RepID=UPI003B014C75